MKRIIFYVFLLVIPAAIAFFGVNFAYKQTNYWKASFHNAERFNNVPDGIKLCNIGTSHGCWGFKWEDYPEYNAFNFAVSGQPYFMDLIMLKHFENKIEKDAIVLIPVSFHQIYKYWEESFAENYHRFLSKQEYPFWNNETYLKTNLFPVINNGIRPSFNNILNDIPEEKVDRFYFDERWTKWLTEEEMKKLVDEHGAQWYLNNFNESSYPKNFDAVCKIVDFCYAHNWKPVFITVPVYDYFYEAFGEMAPYIKKGFYKFSADLAEKYPEIPYWDYSHDEEFSPYIELFMDDDHLNLYGAEKFTARIIEDLKRADYLK